MDSVHEDEAEYYGKCGEMFLTIKGSIAFHCTFCEERFKNFKEYSDHVFETHYAPDLKAELLTDFISDEEYTFDVTDEDTFDPTDEKFDPTDEEQEFMNAEEFIASIEKNEEAYVSTEIFSRLEESPSEKTTIERVVEDHQAEIQKSDSISKVAIRPTVRSVNRKAIISGLMYKCPYCEFTCAIKANIRKHINRHSLNRPHKCKECGKAFYTRTEVNVHMRLHTGERPYLCNLCGKGFVTSGKLTDHHKRHQNKRDKECPECKMGFVNSNDLRAHMKIHSDKREYKCKLCRADFKLADSLRKHMKLHENKREYQCKLCDSNFNQHAGLYHHMKHCHSHVFMSSRRKNLHE